MNSGERAESNLVPATTNSRTSEARRDADSDVSLSLSYLDDILAFPAPYADGAYLALQGEMRVRSMAHEVAVKIVVHAP